jgi:diacylglycerol kinase (ATP)
MKTGVIFNPVAGSRNAGTWLPDLEAALRAHFSDLTIYKTSGSGDAGRLAQQMCAKSMELVIAVGGDGTIGEIADGIVRSEQLPRPALGIVSCGTGSDFARMIGQTGTFASQAARIASGTGVLMDMGRVSYSDAAGNPEIRHFINVASFGLSGATARAVNNTRQKSSLPGRLIFLWHTVLELMRYRFVGVTLSLDGAGSIEARIAVVAAANGQYFGSGMMVAPLAKTDDGLLEFVVVRGASKFSLIRDLRLLYSGRHTNHPAVIMLRGKRLDAVAQGDAPVLIEIDGEAIGQLPASFEIVPQAIKLLC